MFASSTDALVREDISNLDLQTLVIGEEYLLGIGSTLQVRHIIRLSNGSEEYGLELVHAGIGEEKGGVIVRDDGGGGDCRRRGER